MDEKLLGLAPVKTYAAGETIFRQGEEALCFFYLLEGLSLTYVVQPDGRQRSILISWPGRVFGASTLFEGHRRRASATALKPCRCVVFDRDAFERCRAQIPDFADFMLRELSRDLGTLFEELADSALLPSDVKVARFICRRVDRGQCESAGQKPVLRYTQDFIASVLGLSRWQVSRVLSDFQRRGWLRTGYGGVTVLDLAAVRTYGEAE